MCVTLLSFLRKMSVSEGGEQGQGGGEYTFRCLRCRLDNVLCCLHRS